MHSIKSSYNLDYTSLFSQKEHDFKTPDFWLLPDIFPLKLFTTHCSVDKLRATTALLFSTKTLHVVKDERNVWVRNKSSKVDPSE